MLHISRRDCSHEHIFLWTYEEKRLVSDLEAAKLCAVWSHMTHMSTNKVVISVGSADHNKSSVLSKICDYDVQRKADFPVRT